MKLENTPVAAKTFHHFDTRRMDLTHLTNLSAEDKLFIIFKARLFIVSKARDQIEEPVRGLINEVVLKRDIMDALKKSRRK